MKTIMHNRVVLACVPPEYREIKAAFARNALDWCFTVGEVSFPEEEPNTFRFDTWDKPEALTDGSMAKLSAMFCTVIFSCYAWAEGAKEPEAPTGVWCAGQDVTALTKEQREGLRDRAYLDYCRRFLDFDRDFGRGYAHAVRVSQDEERAPVSWGENRFGECEVYYWDSLKSVGCGDFHTVGARKEGRSVAVGSNANGQCEVDEFRNADTIHCGRYHTVALKKVGAVLLASTDERFTECANWKGVIGLRSIGDTVIGVKRDGTVLVDGDPLCPCSRDEIKAMFPDLKLTFPAGFKTLAAKISAEDKRKERAALASQTKKRRKAPASAVELDDSGLIPDKAKKARPVKLEEPAVTLTYAYADALKALEQEFCGEEAAAPYAVTDAAKYLDKNGVPPVGDNCKKVDPEEGRRLVREFLMVCRLCTNKVFGAVLAENAAKSASGKLIKNRVQRITTLRLTHGASFYELTARNLDGETLEIALNPLDCTVKNCRGLSTQPDSRALLEQYCSVQLDAAESEG